ncbi:MAG: hypothetical protein HYX65_01970 [Gemmatimonadetes bacterium]|nr:hypothetical protein [Gemmatimonadota bacterium]
MRLLPSVLALPACALLAACASSPGGNDDSAAATMTRTSTSILSTGSGQANGPNIGSGMTSVVAATTTRLGAPADQVFSTLSSVYEKLGIAVTTMVSKERMLGNLDLRARARLGSMPLRRLFDCGGTTGEPNADTFQLTISVSSEVKDNGDGSSILASLVQATGRPVQFAGNDVRCTTTGELERQIAQQVKLKLVLSN